MLVLGTAAANIVRVGFVAALAAAFFTIVVPGPLLRGCSFGQGIVITSRLSH